MAEHPARLAYVVDLEARLARLQDWATLADENDALRSLLSGNGPIYQQIRDRRHQQGLSQRAKAALSGVTQATVCRVESGAPDVRSSSVDAIAAALGCHVLLIPREES